MGDVRDVERCRSAGALDGVDAVCHQAAKVGLGVDFADVAELRRTTTTSAPRRCCRRPARARLRGAGSCSPSSMVVYGEGRYRCATHGVVRPGPRGGSPISRPVASSRRARTAAGAAPRGRDRGPPRRSAQRLRRDQARTRSTCVGAFAREHPGTTRDRLRYHNVYGPRMPKDTPYAGVAIDLPRRRSSGASRPGCSRTVASGATSCTSATSRPPTSPP